jgi:hypothetical protein
VGGALGTDRLFPAAKRYAHGVAPLPENLVADRAYVEIRFPRRFAFLDRVGRMADELESGFAEADILPTEIQLRDPERDAEIVLAPERIWVRAGKPSTTHDVTRILDEAISVATKHLELDSVNFVGARQVFILPVGTVADATRLFRATFFNYRAGPLLAFGEEPTDAQAVAGYRVGAGICRLRATAISWSPSGEAEAAEGIGALLLDVDRTHDEGLEVWSLGETVEGLLADGEARTVSFVASLQGPGEPADG